MIIVNSSIKPRVLHALFESNTEAFCLSEKEAKEIEAGGFLDSPAAAVYAKGNYTQRDPAAFYKANRRYPAAISSYDSQAAKGI